jgi:hypothetical protein
MPNSKPGDPKSTTGSPDPALVQQVTAAAQAQLGGSAPEGTQAGLKELGQGFGKVLKEVAPGVIRGIFAAGLDGQFTPAEMAAIVADTVRRIMERTGGTATSP